MNILALTTGAAACLVLEVLAGPHALGAVLLAIAGIAFLFRNSMARLAWLVGGGLLVFGGESVGAPKLAYLASAGLVAIFSASRVYRSDATWLRPFRPILSATILLALMLTVSLFVAIDENGFMNWLRDAAPYLLLIVAPVVALDAAHEIRESTVMRMAVLFGSVAAVGFTTDWLNRRGISALPVGRFVAGSGVVANCGFAFALALVVSGPRRWFWAAIATAIPATMLTTGSRSLIGMGVAFIGILGRRSRHRMGPVRIAALVLCVGGLLAYSVPRLMGVISTDPAFLDQRIAAAQSVLAGEGADDGSYAARAESYDWAMAAWQSHRWLGTGPGFLYPRGSFTLDTPLLIVAKFGIIGTAVLAIYMATLLLCTRSAARKFGWRPAHTGLRAFALIVLVLLPLAPAFDDKGFAFTIALVLAAAGAAARTGAEAESLGLDKDGASDPGEAEAMLKLDLMGSRTT